MMKGSKSVGMFFFTLAKGLQKSLTCVAQW